MSPTVPIRVLILEDNPSDAELMVDELKRAGLESKWERVESEHDFTARLTPELDLILSDYSLPQFNGVRALKLVRDRGLDTPFIIVSGSIGEHIAVEAMRHGTDDYLLKDRMARLGPAAIQAIEKKRLRDQMRRSETALKESEARKAAVIETALDCVITIDHEGKILEFNPAAEMTLGYSRAEVIGMPMAECIIPPSLRERHQRGFARYLLTGESTILNRRIELTARRRNGSELPIELTVARIGSDVPPVFTAFLRDITERKLQEQKIEKLSRIRAVSSKINAAIVRIRERETLLRETCRIAAKHGKFEFVWVALLDQEKQQILPVAWTGFSPEAAHAVSWASISAARGTLGEAMQTRKAAVRNDLGAELTSGKLRQEALEKGCRSTVCLPLVVDDTVAALIVLFATGLGFFDEDELALLNEVAADVSFALHAIDKQGRLDYLAYYDVLTGLANRSLFLERVAQYMRSAVAGGHKLALYLIDLERFKNINDSLGRPAGDSLLRQVAEWLTRNLGDANLVARLGADDFAVVLPEVKQEGDVARLLEKSMEAFLDHPFRLNDAVFRIAAKVGVALFPDDGADADTLFKNAEAALKKAKASGDRYLFYTQKMTETVAGKLTLENQLRQALDKGEFVLHYQPKVSLANRKLTGAEALIRWNDPRTGLVPPGQFIPVLEETGLIHEVGRWALRQALSDFLRWRAAGLAVVRIAVNVSPLQLRNRGFIAEIEQAIGIDAHAAAGLELEITESLIMADVKHSIASLQAIRAMGVNIAIDDFGTGYSSLSYLAKLPVDTLKIDRSFVIDMTAGPDGLALVSTIITLAHSLKLKVVAEGVETEEQSRLLRSLNCDEMQGYLFSKPVPGEIFETRFLAPPAAA